MRTFIITFVIALCFLFFGNHFDIVNSLKQKTIDNLNRNFAIKEIEVVNTRNLGKEKVIERIDLKQKHIFNLDYNEITKNLLEIKEIESVKIEKKINGKLKVTIKEKKPFVVWVFNSGKYLVDKNGHILNFKNYKNIGLKKVKGKNANLHAYNFITKIEKFDALNNAFDFAEFINSYRWNVYFKNGMKIKLPFDEVDDSLFTLNKIINENFYFFKESKVIDMTVIGKIFVR